MGSPTVLHFATKTVVSPNPISSFPSLSNPFLAVRFPKRGTTGAYRSSRRSSKMIPLSNDPRCRRHSGEKPISHFAPFFLSFRLSFGNWFDTFVSVVFAFSSIFSPSSIAAAVSDPHVPSRYPCEDIGGYYHGTEGLEGDALRKKLNTIVSAHRSVPYKEVWDALKILDAANVDNPEASSEVIEIYTLKAVPKQLAGKPEGWNREHLWPRSYGLTEGPSLTDLHNIRPADVNVNSSRGNKYYGECVSISSHCMRPANHEAAPDTETDNEIWAPPLQVRGDIARSLMYMAVCYGYDEPGGTPHLQLSDWPSIESREMGLLSTLLKWNELDPPSKAERLRNDRICELYQHNRNPFIDHPEYANLIWKHAIPFGQTTYNPSLKAWVNEFHYKNKGKDQNEFVEIIIGPSIDTAGLKLILYNGATGRMYKSLPLADKQIFTISDGSAGYLICTTFVSLQNGPADGVALVLGKDGGKFEVIQFLSYEGVVTATDGPAKGIRSVDIMVQETDGSSDHDSLGLIGQKIEDFVWRKLVGRATPGKINIGQTL